MATSSTSEGGDSQWITTSGWGSYIDLGRSDEDVSDADASHEDASHEGARDDDDDDDYYWTMTSSGPERVSKSSSRQALATASVRLEQALNAVSGLIKDMERGMLQLHAFAESEDTAALSEDPSVYQNIEDNGRRLLTIQQYNRCSPPPTAAWKGIRIAMAAADGARHALQLSQTVLDEALLAPQVLGSTARAKTAVLRKRFRSLRYDQNKHQHQQLLALYARAPAVANRAQQCLTSLSDPQSCLYRRRDCVFNKYDKPDKIQLCHRDYKTLRRDFKKFHRVARQVVPDAEAALSEISLSETSMLSSSAADLLADRNQDRRQARAVWPCQFPDVAIPAAVRGVLQCHQKAAEQVRIASKAAMLAFTLCRLVSADIKSKMLYRSRTRATAVQVLSENPQVNLDLDTETMAQLWRDYSEAGIIAEAHVYGQRTPEELKRLEQNRRQMEQLELEEPTGPEKPGCFSLLHAACSDIKRLAADLAGTITRRKERHSYKAVPSE